MDYFYQPLEKRIKLSNQNDDNLVYIQVKITDLTKQFKDKIESLEKKVKDLPNSKKLNEYLDQVQKLEHLTKILPPDLKKIEEYQTQLANFETKIKKLMENEALDEEIDLAVQKNISPPLVRTQAVLEKIDSNHSTNYSKNDIDTKLKNLVNTSKLNELDKKISSSLNSKIKSLIDQELKNKNSQLSKKIAEVDEKLNKKIDNVTPLEKKIDEKIYGLLVDIRKFHGLVIEGLEKTDIKIEQIDHALAKLQEKK